MSSKHTFFASAGPLLLVLLIDGMGLGLVFPIMNGLIFDPNSGFLPPSLLTPTMQNLIYGAIVGIFMLCWFFGAAILGDLSDKIGRKKSLMICLFGAFLSYLLSAIAVLSHSLTLLIIGRIVAGFTSGSQPIAQAAIIDLSSEEHKTRNIGLILLSLSIGFIVGPLFGGILSDSNFVSWFNFSIPFIFAAIVAFLNIGLLWWLFSETFVRQHDSVVINPYQAIDIFISAFQNQEIRNLSIIFFLFILGWSSFYSFIAMFLLKLYGFSPTEVSLFHGSNGCWLWHWQWLSIQLFCQTISTAFQFHCVGFTDGHDGVVSQPDSSRAILLDYDYSNCINRFDCLYIHPHHVFRSSEC